MLTAQLVKELEAVTQDIQNIRKRVVDDDRLTYPRILEMLDIVQRIVEIQREIIRTGLTR